MKKVLAVLIAVVATVSVITLIQFTLGRETTLTPEDVIKGVKSQFTVTSDVLKYGGGFPVKYTCDGKNLSPPLKWFGFKKLGTSFVLIMYDPDAPKGIFYHWLLYNIPEGISELPEGIPGKEVINGLGTQGVNDFGELGYGGPCPPKGEKHRYVILVLHLSKKIQFKPGLTANELLNIVKGNVVEYGKLLVYYQR